MSSRGFGRPLMGAASVEAALTSSALSWLESRFRLVDELIDKGESGRDGAAAPFASEAAATVADAMTRRLQ